MPATDTENVTLQERDVSLLVDLLETRVMTLEHVRTLHFSGKNEMAKKRMQRLKAAGLLAERPRRIGEPSILHLTWKGYLALRNGHHVDDDSRLSPKTFTRRMKVSKQTLEHELMIGDVRTAFTAAMREHERFGQLQFDVWPRRYQFRVNSQRHDPMKPDGHVRFVEKENDDEFDHHFFFEADTGSESENWAESDTEGEGENESVTSSTVLIPVMGEEVAEYVSIDEQMAMFEQIINGQDKRECMIRLVSMRTPVALRTLDVPPAWIGDEDLNTYLQEQYRSLPFALPLGEAIAKATIRERDFVKTIMTSAGADEPQTARRKRN
jgi:hypothetical protein